jgi:hypothetical protein
MEIADSTIHIIIDRQIVKPTVSVQRGFPVAPTRQTVDSCVTKKKKKKKKRGE